MSRLCSGVNYLEAQKRSTRFLSARHDCSLDRFKRWKFTRRTHLALGRCSFSLFCSLSKYNRQNKYGKVRQTGQNRSPNITNILNNNKNNNNNATRRAFIHLFGRCQFREWNARGLFVMSFYCNTDGNASF